MKILVYFYRNINNFNRTVKFSFEVGFEFWFFIL